MLPSASLLDGSCFPCLLYLWREIEDGRIAGDAYPDYPTFGKASKKDFFSKRFLDKILNDS
ncbi:MAG: hypothetical protein RIQ52_2069, partial [Pseudomonadota bacterium]